MRIRRRPPLPLSPPPFQNPNLSSLQIQEPANTRRRDHHDASGLHPDGDLSASKPQSDPLPKQVFKEEKDACSSSSSSPYKRTMDVQVHNNERNIGGKMERDAKDESIGTLSNHQASTSSRGNTDDRGGVMSEGEVIVINGRKRRSPAPAVLVEGSRCSRVNGRGWRCSQQTLIGYSLCEHHLGKGRLRSIGSVRGGGRKQPKIGNSRKPREIRERVRAVKARSISSLLGEAAAGPSVDAVAAAGGNMALV